MAPVPTGYVCRTDNWGDDRDLYHIHPYPYLQHWGREYNHRNGLIYQRNPEGKTCHNVCLRSQQPVPSHKLVFVPPSDFWTLYSLKPKTKNIEFPRSEPGEKGQVKGVSRKGVGDRMDLEDGEEIARDGATFSKLPHEHGIGKEEIKCHRGVQVATSEQAEIAQLRQKGLLCSENDLSMEAIHRDLPLYSIRPAKHNKSRKKIPMKDNEAQVANDSDCFSFISGTEDFELLSESDPAADADYWLVLKEEDKI